MMNRILVEDRLDGTTNFSSWKSRLLITLEESDLMKYVEEVVRESTNDAEKSQWRKNDGKARKIIIYYVRDHLIPHVSNLKTTKQMYDALKKLFESNKALALRHQFQNLKMTKSDSVATFFMKILEIRDQLGAIGEIIFDRELVMITLNDLPSHWEPFIQSFSGRSKLPKFDRLW
jgi:hypothetical protein